MLIIKCHQSNVSNKMSNCTLLPINRIYQETIVLVHVMRRKLLQVYIKDLMRIEIQSKVIVIEMEFIALTLNQFK